MNAWHPAKRASPEFHESDMFVRSRSDARKPAITHIPFWYACMKARKYPPPTTVMLAEPIQPKSKFGCARPTVSPLEFNPVRYAFFIWVVRSLPCAMDVWLYH